MLIEGELQRISQPTIIPSPMTCLSHVPGSGESWVRGEQVWKCPGFSKKLSEGSRLFGAGSLLFQVRIELIYYLAHNLNNYKVFTYLFS